MFLNPTASLGGAERVLLDVMASLRDVLPSGSSMHLIAMAPGPLLEEARKLGVHTRCVPMPNALTTLGDSAMRGDMNRSIMSRAKSLGTTLLATPALWRYMRDLPRAVASIGPDIVHANGIKAQLLSYFLRRTAPHARFIWHIHDFISQRPMIGKLLRRFARHVATAIAVSEAVASDLRAVLPATDVRTVLNAIDVDHFSPGPTVASGLSEDHIDDGIIRIGLMATYARWKGHATFIEAARLAMDSADALSFRFYIIGGPIYATGGSQYSRDELVALVARAEIADHVRFVDFQNDPRDAYRSLDIVVHASTRPEPFGRTIVEAMACGRAVIAARGGGASEIIADESSVLGTPPGDAAALSQAILRLARAREERTNRGEIARSDAARRFDRRRLGPAIWETYQPNLNPT